MPKRSLKKNVTCFAFIILFVHSVVPTMAVDVQLRRSPASAPFRFADGQTPAVDDLGSKGEWTLISGQPDRNGGGLSQLSDGKLPSSEDDPAHNFFFRAGSSGGRIRLDLGRSCNVAAVHSYSWHPDVRGPQVYDLYALPSSVKDANLTPADAVDPVTCGWTRIAAVDTRKEKENSEPSSSAFEVSIKAADEDLKDVRYLLFDVHVTNEKDPFAQTFFSEIDVLERGAPDPKRISIEAPQVFGFATEDGQFRFEMEFKDAADLSQWSREKLAPVVLEWYPRIVAQLPSDDYAAPRLVRLRYRTDMNGTPAYAMGNTISLNAQWYRTQLDNEARGAAVHELVHVAQQYGRRDLQKGNARSTPSWVVEGIADYIRWFQYEPQSKGAILTGPRIDAAKYDASYRVTGNFLDWVIHHKDADLLKHLNAAARTGQYDSSLWKERTGLTLPELEAEWKAALRKAP